MRGANALVGFDEEASRPFADMDLVIGAIMKGVGVVVRMVELSVSSLTVVVICLVASAVILWLDVV